MFVIIVNKVSHRHQVQQVKIEVQLLQLRDKG